MKATIDSKKLLKEITTVKHLCNPSHHATKNIMLQFLETGKLMITATSLDVTIIKTIDCDVFAPGNMVIKPNSLLKVLRTFDGDINIESNSSVSSIVSISANGRMFNFYCSDWTLFPLILEFESECTVEFNENDTKRILKTSREFTSDDKYRRVIRHVVFKFSKTMAKVASTDGKTIYEFSSGFSFVPEKYPDSSEYMIPKEACLLASKHINNLARVVFHFAKGKAMLVIGNSVKIICQSSEKKYPEYERAFVHYDERKDVVSFDKTLLLLTIESLKASCNPETKKITMEFTQTGLVKFYAKDNGLVEFIQDVKPAFPLKDHQKGTVCLNVLFLEKIVKCLEGEIIGINVDFNNAGVEPIYFRNVNNKERFLLMPMRNA